MELRVRVGFQQMLKLVLFLSERDEVHRERDHVLLQDIPRIAHGATASGFDPLPRVDELAIHLARQPVVAVFIASDCIE